MGPALAFSLSNSKNTRCAYDDIGVSAMEIFLAIVVLFFALWGLSDCLRAAAVKALVPKNKQRRYIVPICDAEGYFDLMAELELIRWRNEKRAVVLAVDTDMDMQTRALCEKAAEENSCIVLCKPEEIAYIIRG